MQIERPKYDVDVEVVDPAGVVIQRPNVNLAGPNGKVVPKNSFVDATGRVHFPSQVEGEYVVWASAGGFGYGKAIVHVPSEQSVGDGIGRVKVTLPVDIVCTLPCAPLVNDYQVQTIAISLKDERLQLLPIPQPLPPRRNAIARFFSGIGNKLGF